MLPSGHFTCFDLLAEIPGYDLNNPGPASRPIEPRDYQKRVVNRVREAVQRGMPSAVIESPTGSGKTLMGGIVAQQARKNKGWKVGWTAMRKHLLVQAAKDHYEMLGETDILYYSTFTNTVPEGIDLHIEDEGHHAGAETSVTLTSRINPQFFLALTATPYRTDSVKLPFATVIKDSSTYALIEAGYLSQFHQYLFNREYCSTSIVDMFRQDKDRWGPSVVFLSTLQDCWDVKIALDGLGLKSDVVFANSDQETQIEMFNSGELDVLVNAGILSEGFNSPILRTAFVRDSPKKGPIIQMAGRALRKHDSKPYAQIVQSTNTKHPFFRLAPCEDRFIMDENGTWTSQKESKEETNRIMMRSIKYLASAESVEMPKCIVRGRSVFGRTKKV